MRSKINPESNGETRASGPLPTATAGEGGATVPGEGTKKIHSCDGSFLSCAPFSDGI
jgi:hypothetical protein